MIIERNNNFLAANYNIYLCKVKDVRKSMFVPLCFNHFLNMMKKDC